jgi:Spherulation-specific family 4
MKSSLGLLALLATSATATKILLPLYVYPSWLGYWNPLYTAISANPGVTFETVINPNNGPGAPPYPNADYVTGISTLNSHANVQTIGYVSTRWGNRNANDVKADIDIYANWTSYTGANIAVHGIFFDEVDNTNAGTNYTYYQSVAAYARTKLGSSALTVFNMGAKPASNSYFALCSTIVVSETTFATYTGSSLSTKIPAGYAGQSSLLVHDFTGTAATLASYIHDIKAYGVESTYWSSDCCWTNITTPAADIGTVASKVATA